MADLEAQLKEAARRRRRLIATDGVFSMDGYLAPLDEICDLAERYDALVMVDDSHAVGFVGPNGRGTPELFGVAGPGRHLTGTLGKALGGASGGYVSGRARDRRTAAPAVAAVPVLQLAGARLVAGSLAALDLLAGSDEQRERLLAIRRCSAADDRGRLRRAARRAPDHSRSCSATQRWRRDCRRDAGRGRLRHRVLLPGRAEGKARIRRSYPPRIPSGPGTGCARVHRGACRTGSRARLAFGEAEHRAGCRERHCSRPVMV